MGPVKAIDARLMRSHFSAHAGEYDLYAAVQKRVVALLADQYAESDSSPGPILDIGTGTGALAAALGGSRVDRPMFVMDIAHGMSREASTRLQGVIACDADARSLPFASDSFASVVSSSVYQWVESLAPAFSDVARVLKPGGVFALAMFGEKTLFELRECHRQAVSESGTGRVSHVQTFPSTDEIGDALAEAGLSCDRLYSRLEVEYHADVPELLKQLKQIGASNASADRPKGLASRHVMRGMMAHYEARHRSAQGIPATYEVVVAIARKT